MNAASTPAEPVVTAPKTDTPESAIQAVATQAPTAEAAPKPTVEQLLNENLYLNDQVKQLREKILYLQRKQFTPSSEATKELHPLLFNEAETVSSAEAVEPTIESIVRRGKKRKGKREIDISSLPCEELRHELDVAEQVCAQCEHGLHEIGEDISHELKIVPPVVSALKHIRVKYSCRHCERHGTGSTVITKVLPKSAFPGSLGSASAVAFIISQKYDLAVPLYRLERFFGDLGVPLSRQTMGNWVIDGAEVVEPLVNRLKALLVSGEVLHADETRVQVLREAGREASAQSFMWVYRSGRYDPPNIHYDYQKTREADHPKNFLKDFNGYLHVDGYPGYDSLPCVRRGEVKLVGCWAHARRKFYAILESLKAGTRSVESTAAQQGLNFCNKLYKIESELHDATPDERLLGRQERSRPVVEEMEAWLAQQTALPQSSLGNALNYCRNQMPKLKTFLTDGRPEIDNNSCERAVKSFVIGRKNWLFSTSEDGATSSARLYSLIETAKANGLPAGAYIQYLFEQLPNIDTENLRELDTLLPWNECVQAACK